MAYPTANRNFLLRNARHEKRWSYKMLSQECGINKAYLYQLESLRRFPSADTQEKIAKALEKKREELFPEWFFFYNRDSNRQSNDIMDRAEREQRSLREQSFTPIPVSHYLEREDAYSRITQIIGKLSFIDRTILNLRYGLNGKSMTLKQIGNILGYTKERIRQLEGDAIRKLREHPEIRKIMIDL